MAWLGTTAEEEREQRLKQQRQRELRSESMAAMAMAPTTVERSRAKACARESQRELGRSAFNTRGRRDAIGRQGRGCTRQQSSAMVATFMDTRRPLRPFTENVEGDGMADVGSRFGPIPG